MNAIITGGTKGIGLAIANLFAQNGVNIVLNSRSSDDLDQLQNSLSIQYPDSSFHTKETDMSDVQAVKDFGAFAQSKLGKIDILVNNAGIFIPGMVHEEEEGHLEKMMETNLYSAYHLSRSIIPGMIKNKKGHIFNICSIASKIAYPNGGSYSISKFAMLGFSKVLREELKEKGIKVTSVLPGATWSNSWSGVDLPHERLMEAEDIASSIWNATQLSPSAVVEEIILRPQLGDL